MKKLAEIQNWKEMINEVIQGDCLEGMKMIPDKSIDVVLTDPPYGINMDIGFSGATGFAGKGRAIVRKQYSDKWDAARPSLEYFSEIPRIGKNVIIFGGNFFSDFLPVGNHWIVWDKLNTMPSFGDCELIWTNFKRNSVKKITYQYNGLIGKEPWRVHPTQKPVELTRLILEKYSKPTDLICDPFMGSWTTARACKDIGRYFIGFELEENYCRVGEERLRQEILF